jgi:hypothetical protein
MHSQQQQLQQRLQREDDNYNMQLCLDSSLFDSELIASPLGEWARTQQRREADPEVEERRSESSQRRITSQRLKVH